MVDITTYHCYLGSMYLSKGLTTVRPQDALSLDNGCIFHCASLEETRSEVQRIIDLLRCNGRKKSDIHCAIGSHSMKEYFTNILFQAANDSQIVKSFEVVTQDQRGSLWIDVKKLEGNSNH